MRPLPAWLLALAVLAAGCSAKETTDKTSGEPKPSPWMLAADPGKGLGVLEAKKADAKDEVVVVGRVREFTENHAAFQLIDVSLRYCGQPDGGEMDECPEPWDYCCIPQEEQAAATIPVAVKGKDGEVPTIAEKHLPELRHLDLVAVRGRLVKDKDGEVSLEATGWYRRERPNLPDFVKTP